MDPPPASGLPESLAAQPAAPWERALEYLRPLRLDHWIKNLVVPIGSAMALVAHRTALTPRGLEAALVAFLLSGGVSSVNYAVNEILDAPFDARHPVKRHRPLPAGRIRVGPLLVIVAVIMAATLVVSVTWYGPRFDVACLALLLAGLAYNLPPVRLKDWPYLDVVAESVTNPIRLAIGWTAVWWVSLPPASLLVAVWAFGAFLMTGKRLAELRLLGPALAGDYRPTFRAYTVSRLLTVQVAYGLAGLAAVAWLALDLRPGLLPGLPLVAGLLAWALRMTFEPDSPLIDPEHLYRRPFFLLVSSVTLAVLLLLAAR